MHCGPENGSILRLLQHTGPGNGFPPSLHGDRKKSFLISNVEKKIKWRMITTEYCSIQNFQRYDRSFEYLIIKQDDVNFEVSGVKIFMI